MPEPDMIPPQDRPVTVVDDPTQADMPHAIVDVHGAKRVWFIRREDADEFAAKVNAMEEKKEPELMQEDMRDTGTEPAKKKKRAQPKGKKMPRGIPKVKKRAVKRPLMVNMIKPKKPMKKAAAAKKAAKKTTKRRKKRA